MLNAYPASSAAQGSDGARPVWLDVCDPSPEEITTVETTTGLKLPSREDISEIESTSRLYIQKGALYLSTPLVTRSEEQGGGLTPAGFILNRDVLITLRYERVGSFEVVRRGIQDAEALCSSDVFTLILEAVVDRAADLMERVGAELDALSHETFGDPVAKPENRASDPLRTKLRTLGRLGDRLSQVRDALLGVGRIAPFVAETGRGWIPPDVQSRLGAVRQDIGSLNDYEVHLSAKVGFLLSAVLGFINIEQNDAVKVLTVASTIGVPPVLIAGVYGMNFHHMPELNWLYGYPMAIGLMIVSVIALVSWFRFKRWI